MGWKPTNHGTRKFIRPRWNRYHAVLAFVGRTTGGEKEGGAPVFEPLIPPQLTYANHLQLEKPNPADSHLNIRAKFVTLTTIGVDNTKFPFHGLYVAFGGGGGRRRLADAAALRLGWAGGRAIWLIIVRARLVIATMEMYMSAISSLSLLTPFSVCLICVVIAVVASAELRVFQIVYWKLLFSCFTSSE